MNSEIVGVGGRERLAPSLTHNRAGREGSGRSPARGSAVIAAARELKDRRRGGLDGRGGGQRGSDGDEGGEQRMVLDLGDQADMTGALGICVQQTMQSWGDSKSDSAEP